ncbi:MAG: hypothetical protein ACREA0_11360 [bacterium]
MIFAHLGGVDEIGIFLVPAVLAIIALRWAEKRAKARAEEHDRIEAERDQTPSEPEG